MEVGRVHLANWALRTSPKFTTGIKYEFHEGFGPHQRSVVVVNLGFPTLLTSQVISLAFYTEREKSGKFCSEAVIFGLRFFYVP